MMLRRSCPLALPKYWQQPIRQQRCITSIASSQHLMQVVDCHAAGMPARVVTKGFPEVPGSNMMEKREYIMDHLDGLRKLLIQEPRGYPPQCANIILPATLPEASFGFVVMEQGFIYPGMSGHNCICVATALLETGRVPMQEPVTEFFLEAPVGLVKIVAECSGGKATRITLRNQPAFAANGGKAVMVEVPTLGTVPVKIAFGGMWYAIVDAAAVNLEIHPRHAKELCRAGEMIKVATREQHCVQHPEFNYPGPDIMCFRGPAAVGSASHSKNAVVMTTVQLDWQRPETWTGIIDRSPCGTGTCAVMAAMHADGALRVGEKFLHESILGTTFEGCLHEETTVGGIPAVVPSISGQAWITQYA
eukprot:CAMPEP_0178392888 /NCGR_PEP_ID=MMETSP0689_2-20121128/11908_1 /TAXON_ID=160604 /ORGANISM="Amphidinium massartii, Strain CS-259" /LENGTH=361 /DNA_ID=CAMNT_0020013471 /DNA_START=33 /DNA_END=1114 /DNA_ORIENTATION=+